MKKRIFVVAAMALLCLAASAFIFTPQKEVQQTPSVPQENSTAVGGWDKFYVGAMDNPYAGNNVHSNMNYLGFTLWHRYPQPYSDNHNITGWYYPRLYWDNSLSDQDNVLAPCSTYANAVTSRIQNIYNQSDTLHRQLIITRPKITWLCYGQRSDYQCEDIPTNNPLWFYSFQSPNHAGYDITDNSSFGNGRRVRYCEAIPSNPQEGIVVSRLKANDEQCNVGDIYNPWQSDSYSRWKIKPSVRCDTNFIKNNLNVDIFRVDVYNHDGYNSSNPSLNRICSSVVKASNFINPSTGKYDGSYIEKFFNLTNELEINGNWSTGGGQAGFQSRGNHSPNDWGDDNHADIRVIWYGNCDMWMDYVRVDNEIADELFSGQHEDWLQDEIEQIADPSNYGGIQTIKKFYIELIEFNNIPCVGYVNKKLKEYSEARGFTVDLMQDMTITLSTVVPWYDRTSVWNADFLKRFYMDSTGMSQVFTESYPLTACFNTNPDEQIFSEVPSTLPNTSGSYVLAKSCAPNTYDNWLQDKIERNPSLWEGAEDPIHCDTNYYCGSDSTHGTRYWGSDAGMFRNVMQIAHELSTNTGKPFIFMPQLHQWFLHAEIRREPTHEELDMMANLAISYGAKGFQYFWYQSWLPGVPPSTIPNVTNCEYGTGIVDASGNLIDDNYYGQSGKANKIKTITDRVVNKWGPYLMNFNSSNIKSYIYNSDVERAQLLNSTNTYFSDIVTYKPGSGTPACVEDYPGENSAVTPGFVYDCISDRFVQAATFKNTNEPNTNYFMIVNKRCSPYIDETSENNRGGKRYISIKFHANHAAFSGYNNWSIVDLETGNTVLTFDKRVSKLLNLEWFYPGQGKLYKVVPVIHTGGIFAADEQINNTTINLDTTVNTNGKNLTIGANVIINFKNNARIQMNGGNFVCGTVSEAYNAPKSVTLWAQSGMKWGGICLSNMDTVHIQNTEIKDVDADTSNHGYGISLVNAKVVNIDNCNLFNTTSTAAGIQISYVTNLYMNPDINITGNTIKIETDTCDGIYIHPYSWLTLTPYIYANKIINTSSGGGEFGIFGFDLEGTAVKNNYIENFQNGILTWYSSLDLFENTIDTKNISNGWDLYGIVSEYNLSNAYESQLGGSNILTTKDGRNICLDALDINLTDGNNIFNVNDSSYGYHMAGYYPTSGLDKQNAYNNCFKIMGFPVGDEYGIRKNVTESDGLTQVTFDFGTFSCPSGPNYCDFYIGGTPTDTVWIECGGGMGGGHKDNYVPLKTGEQLQTTNYELSSPQENVYKQMYDSLSINMRKKQYELAAEKCITLLDNYPDSAKVINCVDKLYRTALVRNKVSELKSYYEAFIQNHPNNTQIINRMFYYIQKAKARLGQYTSALQGFQTIISQFPTSYEGLAARWDYMATQLLDTSSGSGGGEQLTISNEQLTAEQEHEKLVNLVEDPLDKYDKKKFTKEDRKVFVNNIVIAFETQKTKETKKLKELEVKIIKNEASENEKKEYKTKSKLKEVIRPQKVRNISEQIAVVQSDIKKVFPLSERKGNAETKISVIPLEYKLSQNYPNPFNPTTKINYEIPKGGFVSIKIYDLLGREIAELVNENKDAGRYTIDFNASKYLLASGIYFYRIKAGEFIDTKRMVLVK